jgi:glycerol-3-phosphate dehydrogenase
MSRAAFWLAYHGVRKQMKRDPQLLTQKTFDVLVIGAGVYGAAIAWDASLRGLAVALVDKGDFGSRTSANSLKILHGGLRYLQQLDLKRMRESIRARRNFCRIAPHMVRVLPCVMPTYGEFKRGKLALSLALRLNDWVGYERNWGLDRSLRLPRGKTLSKQECLSLLPGVRAEGLTGAGLWYDCQMLHPERLTLSMILSAVQSGTCAVNYLETRRLITHQNSVVGIEAHDVLTGQDFKVRARVIVNAAGPWVNQILESVKGSFAPMQLPMTRAMNILVKRSITNDVAAGVYKPGGQALFITPWKGFSLIGTLHTPFNGNVERPDVAWSDIRDFVHEINLAYPDAQLSEDDVLGYNSGLLPGAPGCQNASSVQLLKQYQIVDHRERDAMDGLLTVIGVKYTTALDVARKTVDHVLKKLRHPLFPSLLNNHYVVGGNIQDINTYKQEQIEKDLHHLGPESICHLIESYGNDYRSIVEQYAGEKDAFEQLVLDSPVRRFEIIHAIREEAAEKLSDVVLRRTDLASKGYPGDKCLESAAQIMARELHWSPTRQEEEIRLCRNLFMGSINSKA